MKLQRIELTEKAYIDAYISDTCVPEEGRPAMVIFPGGAYQYCSEREAEPVAKAFMSEGFNAFVLYYSVGKDLFGKNGEFNPLCDAARAVAYVRKNCKALLVNPDRITVIGFSAGGHLAGMLATKWNTKALSACVDEKNSDMKPNAAILAYAPSVSRLHADLFEKNAGIAPSEEILDYFSNDKNVTKDTPPCFLWQTAEDDVVPVENSLSMAASLRREKIPFEMHIFPYGGHGYSVCSNEVGTFDPYVGAWVGAAVKWLSMLSERENTKNQSD